MVKAILLDRDGTIIKEKHYLAKPEQIEFEVNAVKGLQQLQKNGKKLFIITNQSGLGRNYFRLADFLTVQRRLLDLCRQNGIVITDFEYCPYSPDTGISRYSSLEKDRKPNIGMATKLLSRYNLNPEETVLIGDKKSDIDCALNATIRPLLVKTGYGKNLSLPGIQTANDLLEAATLIETW